MKWCPDCGDFQPLEIFVRNRSTPDGYGGYCRPHQNGRSRASLARNGGARVYHLRRRYQIDEQGVAALVAAQHGCCAICGGPDPTHLDHDHASGLTRGLLCVPCNNGLGLFRDDPGRLIAAAHYLMQASRAALRSAEKENLDVPG